MYLVQAAPGAVALSVAAAKEHLRIVTSNEDAYLTALIAAVTTLAEAALGGALINRTVTYKVDRFPGAFCGAIGWESSCSLPLPLPPLVSVESVTYRNTPTTQLTLASTDYEVDIGSRPGRLVTAYSKDWPRALDQPNAVTVNYTAGYGTADTNLPAPLTHALKLLVGHLYENRETTSPLTIKEIPYGIECLLMPFRSFTAFA